MANWGDLVAFVRSEYQILEDSGDELRILIEYEDDDRDQVVIITRQILDRREDWVEVASVCGPVDKVNLRRLLTELGETSVVCGVVVINEHVVLRHSLPLENLQINEFTDPLNFVADTADQLEEIFVGGDGY